MTRTPPAPAVTLVVLGALGDLTRRLLVPALVNLNEAGLLSPDFALLGVSYHDVGDDDFRRTLGEFVADKAAYGRLSGRFRYLRGDFEDASTFAALAEQGLANAVFYLATSPSFFGPLVDKLADAGLLAEADGYRRIVVEKPFGVDLASARALNRRILARIGEAQVYRIDHYLGKETVQNLMVLRFANPMIEAVWNSRYIDHVQITAAETVSVGTRGKFYDATGALRDMTPNHLFQLLALVGMEPPNSFDAEAVRTEKAKVIAAVHPVEPAHAVRGRYGAGEAGGEAVTPYLKTADVDPASRTETYVAMRVAVDTWRWSGTPFYLRTGKALKARDTEIVIQFKEVALALFDASEPRSPDRLVIQLQPDEGLSLGLSVKVPGPRADTTQVDLDFSYSERFDLKGLTGYETLLYDVMVGDATLFQRADQIEGGWRAVQPLLDAWRTGSPEDYAAGADGPEGADKLIVRDGRAWHHLG